jgi:hypothetical protein
MGISAALNMGIYQDSMIIIAAIIADIWLLKSKSQPDMPDKVDQMN